MALQLDMFTTGGMEHEVRRRDVPLIMGYGGGVNSFAALIECASRRIVPDLITFADTGGKSREGGEKPETYEHIDTVVRPWLASVGFPDLVVVYNESPNAGYASLYDDCVKKETLPSRAFGMSSCAMRWKIEPQEKYLNHWQPAKDAWARGAKPIKILGYDGGEGRRAEIQEDAKLRYWYPLIEWGVDRYDCVDIIRRAGLPVPPKSACFYCPSSTKKEVLWLYENHPGLFQQAVDMEQGALTTERHKLDVVRGLGRHWSWRDLVAANVEQRVAMADAPVESCMICDDGGDCGD